VIRQLARTVTVQKPFNLPLRGVKPEGRHVYAVDTSRRMQDAEDEHNPFCHVGRHLAAVIVLEKPPQAFVPKAQDHLNLVL